MFRLVLGSTMLWLWSLRVANGAVFCPTTLPPRPAFQPPGSSQTLLINEFWYGTPALWVHLPLSGSWDHLPFNGKSYAQKIFWFSRDYDAHKEPYPKIVVKSSRMDRGGPAFTLERGTNAGFGNHEQVMLTGVILPTTGCWEISG